MWRESTACVVPFAHNSREHEVYHRLRLSRRVLVCGARGQEGGVTEDRRNSGGGVDTSATVVRVTQLQTNAKTYPTAHVTCY